MSEHISTVEKIEEVLTAILNKEIAGMSKDMQDVKASQLAMSGAHEILALAAKSMANTFERAESRQSALEQTNQNLYKDKGITPNVFFLVTGTLCAVIVLGAVWLTDVSVKATLTSFEAGKRQAETLQAVKKEIIEEVKDGHE